MCAANDPPLEMSEEVFSAAVLSIMQNQRAMMNPTNAGAVEKFLEKALMDQSTRIGALDDEAFSREVSSSQIFPRSPSLLCM